MPLLSNRMTTSPEDGTAVPCNASQMVVTVANVIPTIPRAVRYADAT